MATLEEKKQFQREVKALLEGFWPSAFKFNAPKPLKVGIFEEMVSDAASRGLPFDRVILKESMKLYTSRYGYRKALVKCRERYGLEGEVAGEVTDEQKAWAKENLKWRDKKRREKQRQEEQEKQRADGSEESSGSEVTL